tara:strand:+ start:120 stop:413 length:294 start_codon:yes stop_codon:yes gene_type:complete
MVLKEPTKKWFEERPLYKPVKSNKKGKKGKVFVIKNGVKRLLHFGDSNMKDFTQHRDPVRRKSYLARSKGIKDKDGKLTYNNKNSANYWSRKVLWNA